MKRQLLFILLMLVLSGCRLDELHDDAVQPEGRAFSVGQAKEFFEKDFAAQQRSRGLYIIETIRGTSVYVYVNSNLSV